jgi:hypothetical protein
LFELDMGFPGWRETYGVPLYWAPDGLDWVALYPAPRGGAIWLEGYKEPPVLHKDEDFIDLGDEELVRILDYAQWYLSFKEGPSEALENTEILMQNTLEAAALRNARIRRSALYREYAGEHRDEHQRSDRYPVSKVGIRNKS